MALISVIRLSFCAQIWVWTKFFLFTRQRKWKILFCLWGVPFSGSISFIPKWFLSLSRKLRTSLWRGLPLKFLPERPTKMQTATKIAVFFLWKRRINLTGLYLFVAFFFHPALPYFFIFLSFSTPFFFHRSFTPWYYPPPLYNISCCLSR